LTTSRRLEAAITVIAAGLALFGAVFYTLGIVGTPTEDQTVRKAGLETAFSPEVSTTTSTNPLEIAELPDAVSNVLAENGFTEKVSESALTADLSESIVKVLVANDAVLRVANEPGGEQ